MLFRFPIAFIIFIFVMSFNVSAQKRYTPVIINGIEFKFPGDWEMLSKREESSQYSLLEKNKRINVGISARKPELLEFYSPDITGFSLVKANYKWESDYWSTNPNTTINVLAVDSIANFIIWDMMIPQGENISLYGLKSGRLINLQFNVNKEVKMSQAEIMTFLKDIYLKE